MILLKKSANQLKYNYNEEVLYLKLRSITKFVLSVILTLTILCSCSINIDLYSDDILNSRDGYLYVNFLDIGQGDAIFIELPNKKTMLIDAGENYYGEGIIDYINSRGYSKIDYLVATHPHADHIGSMGYIVRNMDIGSVYMPQVSANTKTFENLLESISDKGLRIKSTQAGVAIIDENKLSVEAVAPSEIDEDDLNNCSIVMKLTYGDVSYLFTGDAEKAELKEITDDISADVLKVGHHGSRTSTYKEFLEYVNPSIAVISCGENNEYNHPHKSTINLLENFNCEIYRTDQQGTIIISTDGNDIDISINNPSIERAK